MSRETPDQLAAPRPNHPRWTRARMAAFLRALAEYRSVTRAARAVGMGRQSAYKLRARLRGTVFDQAWAAALTVPPKAFGGAFGRESVTRPICRPIGANPPESHAKPGRHFG